MIYIFLIPLYSFGGLFDDAVSGKKIIIDKSNETVSKNSSAENNVDVFMSAEDSSVSKSPLTLNGYVRGVLSCGKSSESKTFMNKSSFGELSLKPDAKFGKYGKAFADIRFKNENTLSTTSSTLSINEAYVNLYAGDFDFRIGQQIVVWGKADGINPTNNITPMNMFSLTPEQDDRRESNFLIRTYYNLNPLRIEWIWIPAYKPSALPYHIIDFPNNISMSSEGNFPNNNLKHSSTAFRFNFMFPSIDMSLSYFNGFNPQPGISIHSVTESSALLKPDAYRMHVIGADFSSTTDNLFGVSGYGLRGEFAYRVPHKDYKEFIHIINPEFFYVFGIDREFGNMTVLLQYMGRYVIDFNVKNRPDNLFDLMYYEIERKSRIFSSQSSELSNSFSLLIKYKLLHETLNIELNSLYNLTTNESMIRPQIEYKIADNLEIRFIGEIFIGEDDTRYGIISEELSAFYTVLKASF